jgi:hypothetical protein
MGAMVAIQKENILFSLIWNGRAYDAVNLENTIELTAR